MKLFDYALDLVYPQKCGLCGLIGREVICSECLRELVRVEPFSLKANDGVLDGFFPVFQYSGRGALAVKRLKYERVTGLGRAMGELMRDRLGSEVFEGMLVVPVPISKRRMRERGFNQSELLAEGIGGRIELGTLRRDRHTLQQVRLSGEERMRNVEGAFSVGERLDGKGVVLVDDVVTTGATVVACAKTLKSAGANRVVVASFCGEA